MVASGTRTNAFVSTYAVPAEPKRLRVVFGVVWFGMVLVAIVVGPVAVALVFSAIAAVAALQAAAAWRAARNPVHQVLAGVGAGGLPLAAAVGSRTLAVAILVFIAAVCVVRPDNSVRSLPAGWPGIVEVFEEVSATLRSGLLVGIVGAAAVQLQRTDAMSLLFVTSVASVYDSGNHLVGAGMRRAWIGPVAGVIGGLVVVATMSAVHPAPLDTALPVWLIGVPMALSGPVGQWLGSWALPVRTAHAPGLRRIDSWLVAAPILWVGVSIVG